MKTAAPPAAAAPPESPAPQTQPTLFAMITTDESGRPMLAHSDVHVCGESLSMG
jgi:hypothetical protein